MSLTYTGFTDVYLSFRYIGLRHDDDDAIGGGAVALERMGTMPYHDGHHCGFGHALDHC